MKEEDIKIQWNEEAIYSNVCNCELSLKKAALSAKFLKDLAKGLDDEENHPVIAIYELINTLNEIGFDKDIIRALTDIASLLLEINIK